MKRRRRRKTKFLKTIIILVILTGVIVTLKPIEKFKLLNYDSKSIYVYNLTDEKKECSLNATEKRAPA